MGKSILIASGKGGVGKSTIVGCLAVGLAMRGQQVAVVDGDAGMRCMDFMLGLENRVVYDIKDVVERRCGLEAALIPHPGYKNIMLLSASQFCRAKDISRDAYQKIILKLKKKYAYVLVDAPGGVDKGYLNLAGLTDECCLIATPDDVSIRDAEKAGAIWREAAPDRPPMLLVNRVEPELIASGEMYTPATVAQVLDMQLLGAIPQDRGFYLALLHHTSPMEEESEGQQAIERILNRLMGVKTPIPDYQKKPKHESLMRRCFGRRKRRGLDT